MRTGCRRVLNVVAGVLAVGGSLGAAAAPASAAQANGLLTTTEFFSSKAPTAVEIVNVAAAHWGGSPSVSFSIERKGTGVVYSNTVDMTYGSGSLVVVGLNCGVYDLQYTHNDGTAGNVYFTVTEGNTCPV